MPRQNKVNYLAGLALWEIIPDYFRLTNGCGSTVKVTTQLRN